VPVVAVTRVEDEYRIDGPITELAICELWKAGREVLERDQNIGS